MEDLGSGASAAQTPSPLEGTLSPPPGAERLHRAMGPTADSICREHGMPGAWAISPGEGEEVRYHSRPLIAGEKERDREGKR